MSMHRMARASKRRHLNDLAYRSVDGSLPGLNLGPEAGAQRQLRGRASRRATNRVRADLAAFYIKTRDELAVLQNFDGRTVDQNIGETTRRGLELAVDAKWAGGFSGRLAYTYIRAVVAAALLHVHHRALQPAGQSGAAAAQLFARARGKLPAGVAREILVCRTELELCAAGLFDHAGDAGPPRRSTPTTAIRTPPAGYWVANLRAGFEQETSALAFQRIRPT